MICTVYVCTYSMYIPLHSTLNYLQDQQLIAMVHCQLYRSVVSTLSYDHCLHQCEMFGQKESIIILAVQVGESNDS